MAKYFVVLSVLIVGTFAAFSKQPRIDLNGSSKLIGGTNAAEGQYPYTVYVTNHGSPKCGGSIISNEWILTAAHCVQGWLPVIFKVVVGTNKLSSGGTEYEVLSIHIHEDFNHRELNDNIALVKVQPIAFNEKVLPIVLDNNAVGGGVDCVVSGWGIISLPPWSDVYNDLQQLAVKTITNDECKQTYGAKILDGHLCTLTEQNQGACFGDSGGPLVRVVNGVPKVFGVFAWGKPCANGKPDIYTRVSHYSQWLLNIMANN